MRKPLAALFSFLLCSLFFPAVATRAAADDPLLTLRKEHPRLLFTARDWAVFDRRARNRANDPQFDALLAQLEKNARAILGAPALERKLTGRRLLGVSREALRRVLTLAVAHRSTQNDAFLQRAEQEMLAAASFDDWNPSHFLDVAEMTAALALGYDWLHEKLSPETRAIVRRAIVEKGLREGIDSKLRRNSWHRQENNWNQVCLGGLSLGALAVAEDEPALARDMLKAARAGIVNGLRPYAPDGVYPEGPGYWSYGTAYQVLLVAALESALGTDWDLCASPGFLASANTQLHLTGPTGKQFNFSDCGLQSFFDPILYWFSGKLNNPVLAAPPNLKSRERFLPLIALWWPDAGLAPPNTEPGLPLAWKGEGKNPVAVFRSSWTDPNALFLACKAGAANASHGHMDAGSFILEADGVRWAIDLGMQNYESLESKGMRIFGRTQDAQRWTVFRMNNFSHNTLTIDNQPHRVGGRSEFLRFWRDGIIMASEDKSSGVEIDLSPVFAGQVGSVRREISFQPKSRTVFIKDSIEGAAPGAEIRWAMVTKAQIQLSQDNSGGHALLTQNGKQLRAWAGNVDGEKREFEIIPAGASVKNNYDAPNPGTRILIVRAKASAGGSAVIAVELRAGETPR
ncbi:heparinase II/III domain-containing protein [Ereboglobus luteus]|nr:heparinase II/III family protein [Ereboglobus luteus]